MSIEKFLTKKAADSYTLKNHGIYQIFRESFSSEENLRKIFDEEIKKTKELRENLSKALSEHPDKRKYYAQHWAYFLKPRIMVLKFWSTLCTAFMAIYATGASLFTLASVATGNSSHTTIIISSLLLISTACLIIKYAVDKRTFWYEYLVINLDAISAL